jgi:hypothetical protein
MTLRKSATVLRLIIAVALGIGFVGFVTHSHGAVHTSGLSAPAQHVSAAREAPVAVAGLPSVSL